MTAKAAGVMVDLESGEVKLVTLETDRGEGMDPRYRCELLWSAVKDDWPGWEVAYVENAESAELSRQRKLWQVGLCENPEMAARIEAHNASINL